MHRRTSSGEALLHTTVQVGRGRGGRGVLIIVLQVELYLCSTVRHNKKKDRKEELDTCVHTYVHTYILMMTCVVY